MTSLSFRSARWLLASLAATMTLAGGTVAGRPSAGAGSAQPSQLPQVMRVKLDLAQGVLRALVTEDFTSLERHATDLGALTKVAAWGVLKTPEYRRHSEDFLRATESLAASARAGDLNGATLDYASMTFRCVQCHRHVKGVRQAD